MASVKKRFYKPEYFFQPLRLYHRIHYSLFPPEPVMQPLRLSWGATLIANPRQTIGRSLSTFGLYDLPLSEIIVRLVRPGDLVLDVGANVGYASRLMLDCLRGQGALFAFEPLPELFQILVQNTKDFGDNVVHPMNVALSDKTGPATISLPSQFRENDGVATLEETTDGIKTSITTQTLDSINLPQRVRLMKLDVEGHELSVLRGAVNYLEKDYFDYIVYEDLRGYPGPTSKFLEERGYTIYKMVKEFSGLALKDPAFENRYSYEPDNFLATKDKTIEPFINERRRWKFFSLKR